MPTFDAPQEWQQVPNKPLSLATYQVSQGDQEAFLTIIPLSLLTDAMLLPNVNRWRGQVGLPPMRPDDLVNSVDQIPVENEKIPYIKVVGDEANPKPKAMLVAWFNQGGRTWYFKLFGDAPVTLQEEARFKTFVQSVRFSPEQEAGDE